jgi:cation-transporting P-type ATPase F
VSDLARILAVLGLVALQDPLRSAAASAVRDARAAGLRVRILTGDHPATAHAIAAQLELPDDAVTARVTPNY